MGSEAAEYARSQLCNRDNHRRSWAMALAVDGKI
jgi:hypothetical protein